MKLKRLRLMSALPPKADMDQRGRDVRFVPIADSCSAAKLVLFDLVSAGEHSRVRGLLW
jgi:hypothetical protein